MKKLLVAIIFLMSFISVKANGGAFVLYEIFTICDKNEENCKTVTGRGNCNIRGLMENDLFSAAPGNIINLNNAEVTIKFICDAEDYKINITGTNKIVLLDTLSEDDRPVPLTIYGDGTLEIEKANTIKTNDKGEIFYKVWNVALANIDVANSEVNYYLPEPSYTLSDIKRLFNENTDSLYYDVQLGMTVPLDMFEEHAQETLLKSLATADDDLTTDAGREAFIDRLVSEGYIRFGTVEDTGYQQITKKWGLENIHTDLRRSFSSTGSYLINFPIEMTNTITQDGVVIESTKSFESTNYLKIDDITESITENQTNNIKNKTNKILAGLYDISMYNENDEIVEVHDTMFAIKLPITDNLKKYEGYQVINLIDDDVELIETTIEDDHIFFETSSLGKYGVVGLEKNIESNTTTKKADIINPKTADSLVTYGLILISLSVATVIVLFRIKRLKQEN